MTAARAASISYVPAARARQVALVALCDGTGLIIVPTDDGPETSACFGCRACTPAASTEVPALDVIRVQQRAAAALRDLFADAPDDEPF